MEDNALERRDRIAKIFNLMDACKRCGLAFRVSTETTGNPATHLFGEQLRQVLDRFCFELHTEIRRMDTEKLVRPSAYLGSIANADILNGHGDEALAALLLDYERVLTDHLPPHACAMIKRQAHLLKEMSDQSHKLYRTASA